MTKRNAIVLAIVLLVGGILGSCWGTSQRQLLERETKDWKTRTEALLSERRSSERLQDSLSQQIGHLTTIASHRSIQAVAVSRKASAQSAETIADFRKKLPGLSDTEDKLTLALQTIDRLEKIIADMTAAAEDQRLALEESQKAQALTEQGRQEALTRVATLEDQLAHFPTQEKRTCQLISFKPCVSPLAAAVIGVAASFIVFRTFR